MEEKTIWLTEEGAFEGPYGFAFRIGDRVRLKSEGSEGIVKNAKCEGDMGTTGGVVEITYHIEMDDGKVREVPMIALERAVM